MYVKRWKNSFLHKIAIKWKNEGITFDREDRVKCVVHWHEQRRFFEWQIRLSITFWPIVCLEENIFGTELVLGKKNSVFLVPLFKLSLCCNPNLKMCNHQFTFIKKHFSLFVLSATENLQFSIKNKWKFQYFRIFLYYVHDTY